MVEKWFTPGHNLRPEAGFEPPTLRSLVVTILFGHTPSLLAWARVISTEHANVRVFLTHAGSFGTNEAMWAGLPMVGIPLFEDQMDNMVRVEARGAGLTVDIASLTSETLSETIRRVMTEPR